ncbi:MAG TPA: hypothetical protein DDZ04_07225 [Parabacteroides sp.]|nr:hypothetical protein [Parabacteroides sp.]
MVHSKEKMNSMARRWILSIFFAVLCSLLPAKNIMQIHDKPFDISFRIGFNSAFPLIHHFSIEGIEIMDKQIHYKVGYLAAVTFSVNINRFTLQPSVSWYHKEAQIQFSLPMNSNASPYINSIERYDMDLEGNSLEIPILIGYQVVKEGPYGLNLKFGPKGIYQYQAKHRCENSTFTAEYEKDNMQYAFNFVSAVGVTIGRLFLDFSYEFALHNIRSDFKFYDISQEKSGTLSFERRTNVLSFSLGVVF